MIDQLKQTLFEWQLKIMLAVGLVCVAVLTILGGLSHIPFLALMACLFLVFLGQKLFRGDTSTNWLSTSYSGLFKDVLGAILIFVGWVLFLGGLFEQAIAAIFLKLST